MKLLVAQQKIIKGLTEQGDCIVIGLSGDVILKEYQFLNLFVYVEMAAKIVRCQQRAPREEHLTERKLIREIKQIFAFDKSEI